MTPAAPAAAPGDAASRTELPPARTKAGPWAWAAAGGVLLYLALIASIWIVPQVSFCAGTTLLSPPLFYMILFRLRHPVDR